MSWTWRTTMSSDEPRCGGRVVKANEPLVISCILGYSSTAFSFPFHPVRFARTGGGGARGGGIGSAPVTSIVSNVLLPLLTLAGVTTQWGTASTTLPVPAISANHDIPTTGIPHSSAFAHLGPRAEGQRRCVVRLEKSMRTSMPGVGGEYVCYKDE